MIDVDWRALSRDERILCCRAEDGVSMDWSPDGRVLMTATTAPRMRVNNGIQLFRQGWVLKQKVLINLMMARVAKDYSFS